ncbi:MAG: ABC transporter permease [Chloroflexi bacterium]|nr:ABC transporter permease [Chloroflexota bacterium]
MIRFILQRLATTIVTLALVSFVTFIIIELPPGDYAERYAFKLSASGIKVTEADINALRVRFGLDQPLMQRYWTWITKIVTKGDFGLSFQYQKPVMEVIGERIIFTAILATVTLVFTYGLAIPIGVYSAIRQYSIGDYIATILGYIGLAIPSFMLALVMLYASVKVFNMNVGGLFSPEFIDAPWSWARVLDMLKHLIVPALVLGLSGTAFQIRTVRATLLDEKNLLYVTAARAKGLPEGRLLLKYPIRVALNPVFSTIGWELTSIVSGAPIVAMVLNLPDTGPLFLNSLLDQDMYLAGGMLLLLSGLTILGTFLSDVLLAVMDPRIRRGMVTQ